MVLAEPNPDPCAPPAPAPLPPFNSFPSPFAAQLWGMLHVLDQKKYPSWEDFREKVRATPEGRAETGAAERGCCCTAAAVTAACCHRCLLALPAADAAVSPQWRAIA